MAEVASDGTTGEVMYRRTISQCSDKDVDNFGLLDAFDWLENHSIDPGNLQSLAELIQLIKTHIEKQKSREDVKKNGGHITSSNTSSGGEAVIKEIINKDKTMKQELSDVYQSLLKVIKLDILTDDIKANLAKLYGDYEKTLKKHNSEMVNDECTIVVAGETSAGKSSLLNLLLGTDVLPHSWLCATSAVCRLHNSDRKKVDIEPFTGDHIHIELEDGKSSSDNLHEKLEQYISSKESQAENLYKNVDIYWPLPMLMDRVTIVDTSGLGEGDEMTKRLMDYLANAVAFIYVINSSNAGGIKDDRLLRILNKQKRWDREDKLATFDTSCAIFVCNWWDQVIVSKEEEEVWQDTLKKLSRFGVKEAQVFKMSTTEATRFYKLGMGPTEMFQNLLDGIEMMVSASLEAKVREHYRWLDMFLKNLRITIALRLNQARAAVEERRKPNDEITQRLCKLQWDIDKVRENLIYLAKCGCERLVDDLFTHLHQDAVQTRLYSWKESELIDIGVGDMEVTRFNADEKITRRVQEELFRWETNKNVIKELSDELTALFLEEFKLLSQESSEIDLMIEGKNKFYFEALKDKTKEDKDGAIFSGGEKFILAVAAPSWLPIKAAAAVVQFPPLGIGMVIREALKDNSEREKFQKDKVTHMKRWTKEELDQVFTKESLQQFIDKAYYTEFERKIDQVCKRFIPNQIPADQRMVNRLKFVLCKHQLFGLVYDSNDYIRIADIKNGPKIGGGNFSDVYRVMLQQNDKEIPATMKVLRRTLEGAEDMYDQSSELDTLRLTSGFVNPRIVVFTEANPRKLNHPNIVQYYGVSFLTSKDQDDRGYRTSKEVTWPSLMFLFEHCDDTLQNIVFMNERLQCCRYAKTMHKCETFRYYVTMAEGICEGLAFIHKQKYVHRDLKLSNVLVKNQVPKICNLGFARPEPFMSGTFGGTFSHMAPEVLGQKHYDSTADIYSLGILLWELWYGRHVYSEEPYKEFRDRRMLKNLIISGHRPLLYYKYCPFNPLHQLLKLCWTDQSSERPSADKIKDTLKLIFEDTYHQAPTIDSQALEGKPPTRFGQKFLPI